jgi:hypothetical protein
VHYSAALFSNILEHDHLCIRLDQTLKLVETGQPLLRWIHLPQRDLSSCSLRDLVQLLVRRVLDDDMVSWPTQRIEDEEVGLDGPAG